MNSDNEMYCPSCGQVNYKTNYRCTNCGELLHKTQIQEPKSESGQIDLSKKEKASEGEDPFEDNESGFIDPFAPKKQQQSGGQQYQNRQQNQSRTPIKPDNNLAGAILVTIFCCLPFGIVSIVYAAQVDSYWRTGQYENAENSANQSRTWMWVSFGLGLVAVLIWFLANVAG